MIYIDGVEKYEKKDLIKMVKDKVQYKPRLKDVDGRIYKVRELFPHHVLMDSEFGYRRCFTYGEVYYRLN